MLKHSKAFLVLPSILLFAPVVLTTPANAQTKVQVVAQRDQDWNRDGRRNPEGARTNENRRDWNRDSRSNSERIRTNENRRDWNRDDQPNSRVLRLRNGDIRLPNGDVVSARRVVKLRDGYFRLPNGDILLPNEEIVPARRLVRVRDGYFRLPNGVTVQINL